MCEKVEDWVGCYQTIIWTVPRKWGWSRYEVRVGPCKTFDEAAIAAIDVVRKDGWTPPRWWQYWRWGDNCPRDPRVPTFSQVFWERARQFDEQVRKHAESIEAFQTRHPVISICHSLIGALLSLLGLWKWIEILGWMTR